MIQEKKTLSFIYQVFGNLLPLCQTQNLATYLPKMQVTRLTLVLTAIALGPSAIVKVLGQNCFRTLYGSLGQIRLGLPQGSAEGSTKVLPVFFSWGHSCMSQPYNPVRRKRPIMSLLLGYSLGLCFCSKKRHVSVSMFWMKVVNACRVQGFQPS